MTIIIKDAFIKHLTYHIVGEGEYCGNTERTFTVSTGKFTTIQNGVIPEDRTYDNHDGVKMYAIASFDDEDLSEISNSMTYVHTINLYDYVIETEAIVATYGNTAIISLKRITPCL